LLDRVREIRCADIAAEAPRILSEVRRPDRYNAICAEARILVLLSGAARIQIADRDGNRPPGWLARARELLHEEWRTNVTLSRIASIVGMHPCHLAHVFRQYYGESVGSYLRRLRISWAISQLLLDKPISHIAIEAGFSDQSHFTRACKRHLGVTPAAYRASQG
jgi:AraC-like DNA-binding protein